METKANKMTHLIILLVLFSFLTSLAVFGQEEMQTEKTEIEELLATADKLYQDGKYEEAAQYYTKVAEQTQERIDLSRAYFGLSLSCFSLGDMASADKWIRKVLEIDPEKEVSVLFHPRDFVEFFFEVKEETEKKDVTEESQEKVLKIPEKIEEPEPEVIKPEVIKPDLKVIKKTSWEIGVHYSLWTVDPLMSMLEGPVSSRMEEELSRTISEEIIDEHPELNLQKTVYTQTVALDSSGSNYGLEIRLYPEGKKGSFSMGLTFEKTRMKLTLTGTARQEFYDNSYGEASAGGFFESSLFSTHFNFRWNIKPSWKVTPYFVVGLGLAPLKGTIDYSYSGQYHSAGPQETIEGGETLTLKEFEERISQNIPNILFFLQVNFGIRAEATDNLEVIAEGGFWDGFLVRFGFAYKL